MLNIDDPAQVQKTPAILRLGFRPFFLGGATVAALFIPLWLLTWFYPQYSSFDNQFWTQVVPLWWHPHEMLFGFGLAIVCGFLLTAVQTWTNQPSLSGWPLAATFACWLMARLFLLMPGNIPLWVPALFDSLFLGLAALRLWQCIFKVRQWNNIGFPLMIMMALVINLLSYYALYQRDFSLSHHIWQGMLWWLGLVITIVGGRVIPFFTAMKLKHTKPAPIVWLDRTIIALMLLLIAHGIGQFLPMMIEQAVLFVTASLHLVRWLRWLPQRTLKEPMLWSLQLPYLFLPLTLFGLAWFVDNAFAYRSLLHLFAIGCMAGLCLSMISRVSLGHTSRNIYQGPKMTIAFVSIALSAVVRAILPIIAPQYIGEFFWIAGGLWFVAFAMFVWHYAPILSKPRVDGRPG
ncbi:NnrS family protein [Shewanella gelidii]|uniref:Short-chain dehydrogenase n=1 Tax=Shewanella gelidii TaxID=1642821 RepID=A0A917JR60_9GAMM|nr:NnrS family protein [Shewanella gelidii]MCL1097671.1 NnrS family protein [Shewanella gelidii]GGI79686.1 short-chain dehydrogenase [Shewanella gelidii]